MNWVNGVYRDMLIADAVNLLSGSTIIIEEKEEDGNEATDVNIS